MPDADISQLLDAWPYEPGHLQARLITGHDGRVKVQLRLNLGIVQMYPSGRPDGAKPSGMMTFFHVCSDRLSKQIRTMEGLAGFHLTSEECAELREEFAQYYQRCVALMVLEDHVSVARDARHNLRIITFCRRFAGEDEDARSLMRFWPHAAMTLSRAQALHAVEQDEPEAALSALERGMRSVHKAYLDCGRRDAVARSPELRLLRAMRQRFLEKAAAESGVDIDSRDRLERDIDAAVRAEKYELAIALRDQLQAIERDRSSASRGRRKS